MIGTTTGWERALGKDLFSLIRGVSYNKLDASGLPGPGLIPVLRANNIVDGQIVADDLVYVPTRYVAPDQHLREDDVLIAASSGSRSVVGKAATADRSHTHFAFGAFCTVARPLDRELGSWLSSYMRSRAYREYVETVALGININNLRGSDLLAMPIMVAPLPEQRRIVSKTDSLSRLSRNARDHLDHIQPLVDKYKQAILAAAFGGELTADWRKNNPANESGAQLRSALLEQKQQKDVRAVNVDFSGESELPSLPHSWTWLPVEALASKVVDGVHKKPTYVDRGIPFLTIKNLTAGPGISFADCKYVSGADHNEFAKRTRPERGDILITKDGTLGVVRAIRNDEVFSIFVSLALVKPLDKQMTDYLELAFRSPQVQEQMVGVGSGLQHIHLTDLRRDFVPIAPAAERPEIIRHVQGALRWIDRLASEAASARKLIDHLDQAVLAKAFRGELVPQDPNDEPATVLLERIRVARSETAAGVRSAPERHTAGPRGMRARGEA